MKSSVRLTKITSFMFIKIPHYLASNESKEVDAVFVVNILTKELHQGLLFLLLVLLLPCLSQYGDSWCFLGDAVALEGDRIH